MIAARGDGGAQEEDQPRPPSPPPIVPQGAVIGLGFGRNKLGSIRAIANLALPPGPKVGLGLLLQLKEDQHPPQRHSNVPPSSVSSFSDAPSAFDPFEKEEDAYAGDTCITSADRGAQDYVKQECAANVTFQGRGNAGGELGAAEDDSAVDDQQEGTTEIHVAANDAIRPITMEDQEMMVDQYARGDRSRETEDHGAVEYQKEGAIDKRHAAKDAAAVGDQETSVNQRGSDKAQPTEDDGSVKCQEEEVSGKHDATNDVIILEDQLMVVEQCTSNKTRATQNDGHVEDRQADAIDKHGAAKDVINVEDQEMSMDQYTISKSRVTKKDRAMEDHQEGFIDNLDTNRDENVVAYQDVLVAQDVHEEQSAVGDDKVLQKQCTADHLITMDDNVVILQDVFNGRGETETSDDIVVEDGERTEQHAIHELESSTNYGDVEDQQMMEHGLIDIRGETSTYAIAVKDQEKAVDQRVTCDSGTTKNDDDVDNQQAVEQGVIHEGGVSMDDNVIEDHKVVEQSVRNGMCAAINDIIVEDQEKMAERERCEGDETRATKDGYTVEENEKVVKQDIIDNQGVARMDYIAMKGQKKVKEQTTVDNQGTVHIDDIVLKDWEKAVEPYVVDLIITTKDGIDVEHQVYVKEQIIISECGTTSCGTALEDQKNDTELCIRGEPISSKDVVNVHVQENKLEQRISDEQGVTGHGLTVEKHKGVVEHVCHEWGATEDNPAIEMLASEGFDGLSSSDVAPVTVKGSDGDIVKKVKVKLSVGYPQRPGKLNCPFYMSKGSCSYGFSCHFNHPPLKAYSNVSSFSSEQGNHGVAEILDLNRIGLPVREATRNCAYYMRNGTCGYGKKCLFNHPEQVINAQFHTPTGWEDNALPPSPNWKKSSDHTTLDDTSCLNKSCDDATLFETSYSRKTYDHATLDATSYSKKSSEHMTLDNTSYTLVSLPPNILRMLFPPQKVPPNTNGKVKKNSDWSSTSDDYDGCCSADSSDGPLFKKGHMEYPERPGRPECPFYIRFGNCTFGSACKYHHSKDRYPSRYHSKDLSLGQLVEYPERPGKAECPFYMRFGECKFAEACKYHHPKDMHSTRYHSKDPSLGEEQIEYPERPGKPECPFYLKNRFCQFGARCNFHHPNDLTTTNQSSTNANKPVATNDHNPATRITLEDHVPQQQQYPERAGLPECRYYMQFGKCKYLSACIFHHPKYRPPIGYHASGSAQSDQYRTWQPTDTSRLEDICQQAQIGPGLHGMPECPFYKKTGKCHFGSACEFHHLRSSATKEAFDQETELTCDYFTRSGNVLQQHEQTMYPERPGEPECSHYMKHGSCRFEMNCKYHHPRDGHSKKPRHFVRASTED